MMYISGISAVKKKYNSLLPFKAGSRTPVLILLLLLSSCSFTPRLAKNKAEPVDPGLYKVIFSLDSAMFADFNSRNFESFSSYFSEDLEIYQDNIGLRDYRESMEAFRDLFGRDYVLKRELVAGSLEVFPIRDYGAIETGRHTFCHTENGRPDCGTFMFTHIWKQEGGTWKITRIITYGH